MRKNCIYRNFYDGFRTLAFHSGVNLSRHLSGISMNIPLKTKLMGTIKFKILLLVIPWYPYSFQERISILDICLGSKLTAYNNLN